MYDIISFLLEVIPGLFTGTCLLRWYMQQQRIPMSARSGNPLGPFIFAVTDWIVLPLRRVLPAWGGWDWASLFAAYLGQVLKFLLLWAMNGAVTSGVSELVLAVLGVLVVAVSSLKMLVLIYAIASWVASQSPAIYLLERLVSPLLMPIRRMLPLMGGVDLSPLALLLLLHITEMVLVGSVQPMVLGLLG